MVKKKIFYFPALLMSIGFWSCGPSGPSSSEAEMDKIVEETIGEIHENAEASIAPFMKQLSALEVEVDPEFKDPSWSDRRMTWGEEYSHASSPAEYAAAMLEFEAVLKPSAVDPTWANRREAWRVEAESAETQTALLDLLMELETYILWDLVFPDWEDYFRDDWIAECEKAKVPA